MIDSEADVLILKLLSQYCSYNLYTCTQWTNCIMMTGKVCQFRTLTQTCGNKTAQEVTQIVSAISLSLPGSCSLHLVGAFSCIYLIINV